MDQSISKQSAVASKNENKKIDSSAITRDRTESICLFIYFCYFILLKMLLYNGISIVAASVPFMTTLSSEKK